MSERNNYIPTIYYLFNQTSSKAATPSKVMTSPARSISFVGPLLRIGCRQCSNVLLYSRSRPRSLITSTPYPKAQDAPGKPKLADIDLLTRLTSPTNSGGSTINETAKDQSASSTFGVDEFLKALRQGAGLSKRSNLRAGPPEYLTPYHLHVVCSKHNTHITLARPNANALISVSTGNLGFKKAKRGSFDAAFQLASWVFRQAEAKGIVAEITKLEVILNGFGEGRNAVVRAILGNEGRSLRSRITQVADNTKLKFGGNRSPKPRRLG